MSGEGTIHVDQKVLTAWSTTTRGVYGGGGVGGRKLSTREAEIHP